MSTCRLIAITILCLVSLCLVSLCLVSMAALANLPDESPSPNKTTNTAVTVKDSTLTQADIAHAKQWQLTEKEYERYKQILRSPRAYFTPGLDKNPLLALALESRTEIDRQRYADKWVQIQFENNIKVISWQLAVNDAWERGFSGVPRFSYKNPETAHYAVANMHQPLDQTSSLEAALQAKPRAQLYLSIANCDGCLAAYQRHHELLKKGKYSGLDIHFVAEPTKEQIIEWAKARVVDSGLNAADVNQRRVITLNVAKKAVSKVPFMEFD